MGVDEMLSRTVHPFRPLACGLAIAFLAGCDGNQNDDGPPVDDCDAPDAPTWDNHAAGFVATWCQPCHTEQLTTEIDRQGATPGVDFDTWSQVYKFRNPIRERVLSDVEDFQMPPAGGINQDAIDLFVQWIDCGAEGSDDPPAECAAPTTAGDVVLASQAEADTLCANGAVAFGSLEIKGSVTLDCACSVTSDLILGAGATDVSLPLLGSIGGSLRAESAGTLSSLTLPELTTVSGDLVLANEDALTSLHADALGTIVGDLTVRDLGAFAALDIPGLLTVGGAFDVSANPVLAAIDVSRLRTVGGAMKLVDLPSLTSLEGTRALEKIGFLAGGGLELRGLDALPTLDEFAFLLLEEVHGDLVISDNAQLFGIDGFTVLGIDTYMFLPGPGDVPVEIPHEHAIVISDNPDLDHIDGFGNLRVMTGNLEITGSPVNEIGGFVNLRDLGGNLELRDLIGLDEIGGFVTLDTIGGLVMLDGIALPAVEGFDDVVSIGGDLSLMGSGVQAFAAFPALTTLGGDLRFTDNVLLQDLASFASLAAVSGSLEIVNNPKLDLFEGAGITSVGGQLVIDENDVLVGVPGLAGLTTVGDDLQISTNPALPTIADLGAVTTVGGDLTVLDNVSLPTSEVDAWAAGIAVGGEVVISGNQ